MWKRLVECLHSLSITGLSLFFGGYLVAALILAICSGYFDLKREVSLVELLTLGFSIWIALAVPLLLKRLTSDADARRELFLEDVASLLSLYESSSMTMREHKEKETPCEQMQDYVRKFVSSSERSLDLVQREITHLGRFAIPSGLQGATQEYNRFIGDAPFSGGFKITDDFLKKQDDLLHVIRLEVRKYQYSIFLQ